MMDYDPKTGLDLRPRIIVTSGDEQDNLLPQDATNARQKIRLNESSTLEFSIWRDNEKAVHFTRPDVTAEFGGREYCMIGDAALDDVLDDRAKDAQSTLYNVVMKETWNKLRKRFITACNVNIETSPDFDHIDTHMVLLLGASPDQLVINGTKVSAPYPVGTAKYFFWCLLYGTGWTLDARYDAYWPDGTFDLETDKKNIIENIEVLQSLFGGFILWDSKGKRVALVDEDKYQADDGFMVAYGVQYGMLLKARTRQESREIYTRLYVYGNENLNIAAVNGGKEYLDNFSYTSEVLEGIVTHSDIYSQDTLLRWGKKQGEKFCKPRFTYSIDLCDLRKEEDPQGPGPELAKLCDVRDPDQPGGQAILRVTATDFNCFEEWDKKVEVGDVRGTMPQMLKDMVRAKDVINNTVSNTNQIAGGAVRGEIPALTVSNQHWGSVTTRLGQQIVSTGNEILNTVSQKYTTKTETATVKGELSTTISQTASEIRLEASNTYETKSAAGEVYASLNASISVQADRISSTVSRLDAAEGSISRAHTTIAQTANRVSVLVSENGTVNASAVIQSINGQSSFKVRADRIEFDGHTIAQTLAIRAINASQGLTGYALEATGQLLCGGRFIFGGREVMRGTVGGVSGVLVAL